MNLPVCQHRGTIDGDHCECRSNRLIHSGTVPLAICLKPCPYADRENLDLDALRSRAGGDPEKSRGGPGTELRALLHSLGMDAQTGCGCDSKAAEMDHNGLEWCQANRATIIGWLSEAAAKASWLDKLRVAAGGYWSLDALLDEALRRAAAKIAEQEQPQDQRATE